MEAMLSGVAAATAVDRHCHLPGAMTESFASFVEAFAVGNPHVAENGHPTGVIIKCLSALQSIMIEVCDRLYALPRVSKFLAGESFTRHGWQEALGLWASEQSERLLDWTLHRPECGAPKLQLRISGAFLEDFGRQLTVLAGRATWDNEVTARSRIFYFQSAWSMALYYLTCLQYFCLGAFEATNELAYMLHRHRFAETFEGEAWWPVAVSQPVVRLRRNEPLFHDVLSGAAVVATLHEHHRPGKHLRFAEVGVFRANLSSHVWRRAAFMHGSLEMHLVDHWGAPAHGVAQGDAHTGSDMGGSSNASLFHGIVRHFSRTATCVQVPYWLPGGAPRAVVALGGDVFFHRTTSVGAANSFDDGFLDAVYIDADHKWWSVIQDLAAWWPKVRIGGVMMGHDFHLNTLMEREGAPGGDSNDVPLSVLAFFRAPHQVVLHSGFVWSVTKLSEDAIGDIRGSVSRETLCAFLRERMAPHWDFEICK